MQPVQYVPLPRDVIEALDRIRSMAHAKNRIDVIRQAVLWLSRQDPDTQRFVLGYPWMRNTKLPSIERTRDQSFDRNVELALGDLVVVASALYPHEIREYQQDMIEALTTVPPIEPESDVADP